MTETDALPTTIAELGNALRNASAQEAAWRSHREALDRHLDVLLAQEPETARDTDIPAADAPVTRTDAPAMRDQHAATIDRVTAECDAIAAQLLTDYNTGRAHALRRIRTALASPPQPTEEPPTMTFTRGFRFHTPDGDTYDGAAFPSGRHFVLDHPERGLATATTSMEELLKDFPGARIEWNGLNGAPR